MEPRPTHVALIVNPSKRGSARTIEAVRRLGLEPEWADPLVLETTMAEPGAPQARAALEKHPDIVIAAGGDGTVREVASVMAGTDIPLGIVPLGTANLFARNLRLPARHPERCLKIALFGNDRRVDVGRILITGPEPGAHSRDDVFLVVAGFGMDANAFARTSVAKMRRLGWFAYFDSLTRTLFRKGGDVGISLDEEEPATIELWSVMVANCGRIPAGLRLIPRAEPDDGALDIVVMAPRTPADWIPIAGKIILRTPFEIPALSYRRATSVRIRPNVPVAMQLDGDVFPAISDAIIRIAPGTLRVRCVLPERGAWAHASKESHKLPPAPPYA